MGTGLRKPQDFPRFAVSKGLNPLPIKDMNGSLRVTPESTGIFHFF
jgi:hypothetical protein